MRVTWTVEVAGRKGRAEVCRDEKEAARLVLELLLAGVKRSQIIVDGKYTDLTGLNWVLRALDL